MVGTFAGKRVKVCLYQMIGPITRAPVWTVINPQNGGFNLDSCGLESIDPNLIRRMKKYTRKDRRTLNNSLGASKAGRYDAGTLLPTAFRPRKECNCSISTALNIVVPWMKKSKKGSYESSFGKIRMCYQKVLAHQLKLGDGRRLVTPLLGIEFRASLEVAIH